MDKMMEFTDFENTYNKLQSRLVDDVNSLDKHCFLRAKTDDVLDRIIEVASNLLNLKDNYMDSLRRFGFEMDKYDLIYKYVNPFKLLDGGLFKTIDNHYAYDVMTNSFHEIQRQAEAIFSTGSPIGDNWINNHGEWVCGLWRCSIREHSICFTYGNERSNSITTIVPVITFYNNGTVDYSPFTLRPTSQCIWCGYPHDLYTSIECPSCGGS